MDYPVSRNRMVDEQLIPRGIRDPRVLDAFHRVDRHLFVPEKLRDFAYADHPLPIGGGQTISQPYIAALMTEALCLNGNERVLEIGTGSGYQAAILAELYREVYSVERIEDLAGNAKNILEKLGYNNIRITSGDGTLGWEEHAPYDGIIVTAGAPRIPESLIAQLKDGGRLVIPLGGMFSQALTVVTKKGGKIAAEEVCGCCFVPLIGKEGWER